MDVAIIKDKSLNYDTISPFNPNIEYPEYPFCEFSQENKVYDSVRRIFKLLSFDKNNYNTKNWNPLSEIIQPGDNVLIKPNLVRNYNLKQNFGIESIITNGSLIRAVIDYVYMALADSGSITVADAPLQSANFDELIRQSGLDKIRQFYKKNTKIKINILDLRTVCTIKDEFNSHKNLKGDPLGYVPVDLNEDSKLFEISKYYKKFRVTNYHKTEMIKHHNDIKNEYLISKSALKSDVIINLPKLKTHRKSGISAALKNMIGINGSKDWLPHHRSGSKEEGGDEYLYKSIRKQMITELYEKMDGQTHESYFNILHLISNIINLSAKVYRFKDPYFEGSWYGNDTIPRTIIDINKIIYYANKNGILKDNVQRKHFTIVDAIIAGEGEGPTASSPKKCGLLVAGYNPVAIDYICSLVMGFDYKKIPTLEYSMRNGKYKLFTKNDQKSINLKSDEYKSIEEIKYYLKSHFIPPTGWKDHIELN